MNQNSTSAVETPIKLEEFSCLGKSSKLHKTRHLLCLFNSRGLETVEWKCIVALLRALPRITIKTGRAVDNTSGQGYRRRIHTCKRGKQANEVNKQIAEIAREKKRHIGYCLKVLRTSQVSGNKSVHTEHHFLKENIMQLLL